MLKSNGDLTNIDLNFNEKLEVKKRTSVALEGVDEADERFI